MKTMKYGVYDPETKTLHSLDGPRPRQTEYNSVGEGFLDRLQKNSSKVLFIDYESGSEFTAKQVLEEATALALSLHDLGIRKDDVIFDYLPLSFHNICLFVAGQFLACIKSGMAPHHVRREVISWVQKTEAKVISCISSNLNIAQEAADLADSVKFVIVADDDFLEETQTPMSKRIIPIKKLLDRQPKLDDPKLPIPVDSPDAPCAILQSSGTTGEPKGIIRSQTNTLKGMVIEREADVQLQHTPLSYFSGLNMATTTIASGGKTILLKSWDIKTFLEAVQKYQVTYGFLSPSQLMVLGKSEMTAKYNLSSLKVVFVGGQTVTYASIKKFREVSKVNAVVEVYASTEMGWVFMPVPTDGFSCAGRIGFGNSLRIYDAETDSFLGPGLVGELCVTSDDISPGYYKNSKKLEDEMIGDFLRSGDLAYFDENGLVFIVGRLKEMIKVDLHQVAPKELEEVLMEHEWVEEAAVAGAPDDLLVQVPRAFVVLKEGAPPDLTEEELRHFVDSQVVDGSRLRGGLVIVKSLPKISFGKVDRRQLLNLYPRSKNVSEEARQVV